MSLLFSQVTIYSDENGYNNAEFLIPGIPRSEADLWDSDDFAEFMDSLEYEQEIIVYAEAYTFGKGKPYAASCGDIEILSSWLDSIDSFLNKCESVDEVEFSFIANPAANDKYRMVRCS